MFGSLIKATLGVVGDVATIALAPVAVTTEVARVVTKPIAEAAEEVSKDIRESLNG